MLKTVPIQVVVEPTAEGFEYFMLRYTYQLVTGLSLWRAYMPIFGSHYRAYRLAVALQRLRDMPTGTLLTRTKAAHLLGINEAALQRLIARYAPNTPPGENTISSTVLYHAVRMAYQNRKQAS